MRDKRELSRDVAVKYGEVPIFSKDDADTPVQDVLWALSVREDVRRRSKSRSVHTFDDLIGDLVKALRDPYRGPLACATLAHRFGLVMVDGSKTLIPCNGRYCGEPSTATATFG